MDDIASETRAWLEGRDEVDVELGVLVAAASDWTEDERELDDLVSGLVGRGRVRLAIG